MLGAVPAAPTPRSTTLGLVLRAIAREPLAQFALVALAIFGVAQIRARAGAARRADTARAEVRASGPEGAIERHLVVEPETIARLVTAFEQREGRAPSEAERREAVARWVDQELLFREAVARKLDRGDERVRQLLADKMRALLEREALGAPPTEAEVRAAFDADPARWAKEEAFDFIHVFVHGDGPDSEARATSLRRELEGGADPARLGDLFQGGRRYRRRSLSELSATFGPEFTRGLASQPVGSWASRRSRFGFHVVRVEGHSRAEAPSFEEVRETIAAELGAARREADFDERLKELRARWTVIEGRP